MRFFQKKNNLNFICLNCSKLFHLRHCCDGITSHHQNNNAKHVYSAKRLLFLFYNQLNGVLFDLAAFVWYEIWIDATKRFSIFFFVFHPRHHFISHKCNFIISFPIGHVFFFIFQQQKQRRRIRVVIYGIAPFVANPSKSVYLNTDFVRFLHLSNSQQ